MVMRRDLELMEGNIIRRQERGQERAAGDLQTVVLWVKRGFCILGLVILALVATMGFLVIPPGVEQVDKNQSDPLMNNVTLSEVDMYLLMAARHRMIGLYLKGRSTRCFLELEKYSKKTAKMTLTFAEDLAANDGYDGNDPQQKQVLMAKKKEIDERLVFEECMEERMAVLDQWKKRKSISKWTLSNAFDWRTMIQDNGWCSDRNECFCDILLSPDEEIEEELLKNQKEIEAMDELLEIELYDEL